MYISYAVASSGLWNTSTIAFRMQLTIQNGHISLRASSCIERFSISCQASEISFLTRIFSRLLFSLPRSALNHTVNRFLVFLYALCLAMFSFLIFVWFKCCQTVLRTGLFVELCMTPTHGFWELLFSTSSSLSNVLLWDGCFIHQRVRSYRYHCNSRTHQLPLFA